MPCGTFKRKEKKFGLIYAAASDLWEFARGKNSFEGPNDPVGKGVNPTRQAEIRVSGDDALAFARASRLRRCHGSLSLLSLSREPCFSLIPTRDSFNLP